MKEMLPFPRARKASSTSPPTHTPSSSSLSRTPPKLSPSSLSSPQPQPQPPPPPQLQPYVHLIPLTPIVAPECDILEIVDAYNDQLQNPKYAFKHLLFSVTEPQNRVKFGGVSLIMWEEAMEKLKGMESADRQRLWPQLIQGFKNLTQRLQIQDEVIVSDAERLRINQSNVKMLQRYFQFDILTRIQRIKQKEQILQGRLLRVMRIDEALEGKGCRIPLTKGEAELPKKLATIRQELKGSGVDLCRRVRNLQTISRVPTNSMAFGGSIHGQSLADLHEIFQQQTDTIARLSGILKRDIRHMEIMMAKDA